LTAEVLPFDAAAAWAVLPRCGAVVSFAGTARDHSTGRDGVTALAYEAYEQPALDRMAAILVEARVRWPDLGRLVALHRVGEVPLGEAAVVVVASAPHRGAAFAAARYVIDTVKASVPIWKLERWAGGSDWAGDAQRVAEIGGDRDGRPAPAAATGARGGER
jgi:molybdopterin synthase catalytic subunit